MTTIFIGGPPRSGTTLMQSVLCADRTTNPMLGEPFYFRKIVFAYKQTKYDFTKRGTGFFNDPRRLRDFSMRWVHDFLDQVKAAYPTATNLVLKEPLLTRHFAELSELVPGVRLIVMVRDPRDIIASTVRVAERMGEQGQVPENFEPAHQRDMAVLCDTVNSYYLDLIACREPRLLANLCFMFYEALASEPARAVDEVRQFTGLALNGYAAERAWNENASGYIEPAADDPWPSDLWGKPVDPSRIGSYRDILSANEIAAVEDGCRQLFETFGYARDGNQP